MGYFNPLLAYGLDRLPDAAASAVSPDSSFPTFPSRKAPRCARPSTGWLALIQMVTPVTPASAAPDALRGEPGIRLRGDDDGHHGQERRGTRGRAFVHGPRARRIADPGLAGFGIRGAEQVELMKGHVDGVVVGSALVEVLERGEDPAAFLRSLTRPSTHSP